VDYKRSARTPRADNGNNYIIVKISLNSYLLLLRDSVPTHARLVRTEVFKTIKRDIKLIRYLMRSAAAAAAALS